MVRCQVWEDSYGGIHSSVEGNRTGLRKKDEHIAEFINRFEVITRKLEVHGVKLDKKKKSVVMVEMVQLGTAKGVAVLSIVKFKEEGEDDGLEDRMKAAMCSTACNIMGKEKGPENNIVLCVGEEEQPSVGEPEQVYWDGSRWMGIRKPNSPNYNIFQGGQQHQPSQTQLQRWNDQRG